MNICIYSGKSESEVTFNEQEHIFPASLGGISKLPKGYVSDEINHKFSKELELEFSRESPLSIVREFIGPGSRGNVRNARKAYKSKIHIMEDENNNCTLGYISLGLPISIKQIIFSLDDRNNIQKLHEVILPYEEDDKKVLSEEVKKFIKFKDHLTDISDNKIPKNKIIIGLNEYRNKGKGAIKSKWFIAHNKSVSINNDLKNSLVEDIKKLYDECLKNDYISNTTIHNIKSYQNLTFNIETFFRTCAKIAFNYSASILGSKVLQKNEFNEIRNYITNGGENKFVNLIEKPFDLIKKLNGNLESPHILLAYFEKTEMFVFITFYNKISALINIPYELNIDEIDNNNENVRELITNFKLSGLIIDWNNRKELELLDYVDSLNQDHDKLSQLEFKNTY